MQSTLDPDACYRACSGREARFDGRFYLGVTSTGIYCRPSCPARTPRPENCRYFPTAAAAVAAGFRACRRCRPDALPGSSHWDYASDFAARAVRLIRDGVVDEVGVAGLAARLAVSERQLHRVLIAEVGASAQQLNQTRRAQVARTLIDQTPLSLTDIAFASGFGSVRQFNDVMRAEFGCAPSALRRARPEARVDAATRAQLVVRLPYRPPLAFAALRATLSAHAVPGVEQAGDEHHRLIVTPAGAGLATVVWPSPPTAHLAVRLELPGLAAALPMIAAVRRWLDLDADPALVDAALSSDGLLAPLVAERPGLRVPGAIDGAELAMFVVLGQQISLAAARTVQARLIERFGASCGLGDEWRTVDPATLAEAGPALIRAELNLTRSKAATLHALAVELAGGLLFDPGADRTEARRRLLAIHGVGEWTSEFIAMRALGDPDAFPADDLVLRRALGLASGRETRALAEAWRPWRAYATMHLWIEETLRPRREQH